MSTSLEIRIGRDESFTVAIQKNGVAADLTGTTVVFCVKRTADDTDAAALIKKELTITSAAGGLARLDLEPDDTTELSDLVSPYWEILVEDSAGKLFTPDDLEGVLTVLPRIAQSAS